MKVISTPRYRVVSMRSQYGAVLIVSLIFLLLMTIIGVTAMQTTTLQERMAGNTRDHNLAFQAAEAALREGESWIKNNHATHVAGKLDIDDWLSAETWADVAQAPHGTISLDHLAADAGFHVGVPSEVLDPQCITSICVVPFYPVTARSVGGTNSTVVILQSMFFIAD